MRSSVLVVVVASALFAVSARAEAARRVVLGSFGGSGASLREAVELELVVREDLLLSDPDELELQAGDDLGEASPSKVGRALDALQQDAVLRAEPRGPGIVVVFVQRAGDGAIVYGRRVDVVKAREDLKGELLDDLIPALVGVRSRGPLSPSALAEIEGDVDVVIDDPDRPVVDEKPPPPPPKVDDAKPRVVDDAPRSARLKDAPAESKHALVRLSGWLAPHWYNYRACPFVANKTPFMCTARASAPPTEVSAGLAPELGLAFAAELAPTSFLAIVADGSLFFMNITATFPSGSDLRLAVDGEPQDRFGVVGGTAAVGLLLRWLSTMGATRTSLGAQIGYRALFVFAEDNSLLVGDTLEDDFVVLPSYTTNAVAIGPRFGATFADRATVGLEVDLLPGLHLEWPREVGASGMMGAFGVHAKASVEVDLVLGLFVGGFAAVDAMNADAEGAGTRLTRALQPFSNAQVDFWQASLGAGLGWRW
jgi:hypothetical protein